MALSKRDQSWKSFLKMAVALNLCELKSTRFRITPDASVPNQSFSNFSFCIVKNLLTFSNSLIQ